MGVAVYRWAGPAVVSGLSKPVVLPANVVRAMLLVRGAIHGGITYHDRGGPLSRTKGAERVVTVDVTGRPVGALVVPASTHENVACQAMLAHLAQSP